MDLISREEALKTFGLSEKSRKYGGDHSGYQTIMLYEVQDALEALPSEPRWIPVNEKPVPLYMAWLTIKVNNGKKLETVFGNKLNVNDDRVRVLPYGVVVPETWVTAWAEIEWFEPYKGGEE